MKLSKKVNHLILSLPILLITFPLFEGFSALPARADRSLDWSKAENVYYEGRYPSKKDLQEKFELCQKLTNPDNCDIVLSEIDEFSIECEGRYGGRVSSAKHIFVANLEIGVVELESRYYCTISRPISSNCDECASVAAMENVTKSLAKVNWLTGKTSW